MLLIELILLAIFLTILDMKLEKKAKNKVIYFILKLVVIALLTNLLIFINWVVIFNA